MLGWLVGWFGWLVGWLVWLAGLRAGLAGWFGWLVWLVGLAGLLGWLVWLAGLLAGCLFGHLGSPRAHFGVAWGHLEDPGGSLGGPLVVEKYSQGGTPDLIEIGSQRSIWICK